MFLILSTAIYIFLTLIEWLLFARIIASLIAVITGKSNAFFQLLFTVTEPILAPVRNILNKSDALSNLPLDFSVLIVYLIINLIKSLL